MKDCNALTLPSPNVTNTTATAPIRTAKNARNHLGGFLSPEIAIEIVSDIESVVVNTKTVVTIKNNTPNTDRKSTRLNSSHVAISYAVFCLKKKNQKQNYTTIATST